MMRMSETNHMQDRRAKNIAAWEGIRAKGKWNFFLKRGILGFSLPFFLFFALVVPYWMHSPDQWAAQPLFIKAVMSLILGIFSTALYWTVWDRMYGTSQQSSGTKTR
jgi:hypothetical protein